MPITLKWENDERRVIRWDLTGEMDWAEFDRKLALGGTMLDDVSYPVNVIAFAEDFHLPPDTPLRFPGIAQNTYWQHPNLGTTVVIGPDHFFKMMVGIYKQVYDSLGSKIVVVASLEEAYQFIEDLAS